MCNSFAESIFLRSLLITPLLSICAHVYTHGKHVSPKQKNTMVSYILQKLRLICPQVIFWWHWGQKGLLTFDPCQLLKVDSASINSSSLVLCYLWRASTKAIKQHWNETCNSHISVLVKWLLSVAISVNPNISTNSDPKENELSKHSDILAPRRFHMMAVSEVMCTHNSVNL